jgi:putative ABC transport system ATP-binding protein
MQKNKKGNLKKENLNKNKGNVIRLENISKHYKMGESIVKAVDGLSLEVQEGDFVAIMGPSGSGKSTSMNLVGSLDVPTLGRIFLDGLDISEMSESDLAQLRGKKIGFIFQQFNLIPNLTAKENIMLPMMFQGVLVEERRKKAEELLRMVDLGNRMDHYPGQLSGGQQQRVAIARSLANDPEVVLADEPTGNLDTKTGENVMNFLEKLNKQGKTIIMVTHDPELAQEHANVVYWLKDGKLEKITRKKRRN